MQLESIRGDYARLLCKSEEIKIKDENVFFGAGTLIFSGGGKIKEFYLTDTEAIIFSKIGKASSF